MSTGWSDSSSLMFSAVTKVDRASMTPRHARSVDRTNRMCAVPASRMRPLQPSVLEQEARIRLAVVLDAEFHEGAARDRYAGDEPLDDAVRRRTESRPGTRPHPTRPRRARGPPGSTRWPTARPRGASSRRNLTSSWSDRWPAWSATSFAVQRSEEAPTEPAERRRMDHDDRLVAYGEHRDLREDRRVAVECPERAPGSYPRTEPPASRHAGARGASAPLALPESWSRRPR